MGWNGSVARSQQPLGRQHELVRSPFLSPSMREPDLTTFYSSILFFYSEQVKLADKLHNVLSIQSAVPTGWTVQRVQAYFRELPFFLLHPGSTTIADISSTPCDLFRLGEGGHRQFVLLPSSTSCVSFDASKLTSPPSSSPFLSLQSLQPHHRCFTTGHLRLRNLCPRRHDLQMST